MKAALKVTLKVVLTVIALALLVLWFLMGNQIYYWESWEFVSYNLFTILMLLGFGYAWYKLVIKY